MKSHAFRALAVIGAAGAAAAIAVLSLLTVGALRATPAAAQIVQPAPSPVASDVDVTVTSTTPPQPVVVALNGSDIVGANGAAFSVVTVPGKGTLSGVSSAVSCVAPMGPSGNAVFCSATITYTPTAAATGTDAFTYGFSNGGRGSAPATVTVHLPGGAAGTFDRPINKSGINPAVWNGGTIDQLLAATAAAGGTTVTTFVNGQAVVLIPGAPQFVAAPFEGAFPTRFVPAGTIVFIARAG